MTRKLIREMGHVALQSSRLDESLTTATELLGLRETKADGGTSFLSASDRHHELLYRQSSNDAVDHFGLVAADADALVEIRERIERAGFAVVSDTPLEEGVIDGFAFLGPDGFVFEIYLDMETSPIKQLGFGPDRYGHINLHSSDPVAMRSFFIEILGFHVSDVIGDDALYFLRCNPDHHGVAIGPGRGTLHHHAWQAQSVVDLGKLADRLDAVRKDVLWGPVRHGAGHNIATYFAEPGGSVIELYTDMEQIYDDNRPPHHWTQDDNRWFSRWAPFLPERFREFGMFPASRFDG